MVEKGTDQSWFPLSSDLRRLSQVRSAQEHQSWGPGRLETPLSGGETLIQVDFNLVFTCEGIEMFEDIREGGTGN